MDVPRQNCADTGPMPAIHKFPQPLKPPSAHARPGEARGPVLDDPDGSDSTPWESPIPLMGYGERKPYPMEALPPRLRSVVEEVSDVVQVAPEMVASSALAVASLACQSLADVRRNAALAGPCSLFFLTVADSGDRKSTVDRLLGRALHAFQDREREAAMAALVTYSADLADWEGYRAAVAGEMKSLSKGQPAIDKLHGILIDHEAEKPIPPRTPRLLYTDVTTDKLLQSLATGWPSAGILAGEAGGFLGTHSMGRDAIVRTLSALNTLWDGGQVTVDRKFSPSFAVRGARLTMHLMAQSDVLADFLEHDRGLSRATGFFARFLVSRPPSRQGARRYREVGDMPHLAAFNGRIAELLAQKPSVDAERGMTLPVLDLSPKAKAMWVLAHDTIEEQIATRGSYGAMGDLASKAAETIARLAAVLEIFEHGLGGPISLESVNAAAFIVLWHLEEAQSLLEPLLLLADDANAVALDRWFVDR